MGTGVLFPICAIPFSLLVIVLFLKKGHVNNSETKIYQILIVSNFIGLIIEILCTYASMIYNQLPFISNFIYKSYLVYLITWTALFTIYIHIISRKKQNKINETKKTLMATLYSIVVFITYVLPIELVLKDNFQTRYTTGPSVNFAYLVSGVLVFIIMIMIMINIKNILSKKYIPVFVFFIVGTLSIIIQKVYPQFLLLTYVETLICVIMYFTIENPDLKMLRNYHEAKEYAEDLNIEKQMFIYNISQDMKQPLLKISRFCERILYSENIEEYKDGIRSIKSECNSMLQNINGIFDVDVKDIRDLSTDNTKYNIHNLLKLIDSNMKKEVKESGKKIDFISSISDTIPKEVIGDSARIKEVLRIVFENALKHTKEGYIEFKVSEIHKNHICRLMITIEDSGVGIDASKLEELFDRERIVDKNISDRIDESKENLALAKKIINILGGNLIVTSQLNVGTKVSIILDQEIVDDNNPDIDKYDKEYFQDKKILVLGSTEEEQVKLMRAIVEFGGVMEITDSITNVIDKLKKHNKYYAIILDNDTMHRTASEMMDKLKEMKGFNTPVIILTKDKGMKSLKTLAILGFAASILRPVTEEDVTKALNKINQK